MRQHMITLILTCVPLFASGVKQDWNESLNPLIVSHFKATGIRSVSIYACSKEEAISVATYLTRNLIVTMKFAIQIPDADLRTDSQPYVQGVLINLSCTIDLNPWATNMFNTSYKWLAYTDDESTLQTMERSDLNFLSDVILVRCDGLACTLYDVFRVRNTDSTELIEHGRWENSTLFPGVSRKSDVRGTTLVGGLVLTDIKTTCPDEVPTGIEDRSVFEGSDTFSRFHISLYRNLEIMYNFRLKLMRSETYGYPLPNGSYDGLVGDILNGRIDVGLTSIEPRAGRAKHVAFLMQTWIIRIIFVLRQPRATGSFLALILPLSSGVWACVFIFMILFLIAFETIRVMAHDETIAPLEGFVIVVGVLAQQGLSVDSRKTSSRVLSFFLLFLGLILMTYYNAAIMNALLLPVPVSIRSLEQLIAPSSPVKPGLLNITYLVDNRSSHKYVLPNTLKAVRRTPDPVMDIHKGIKRVKDTNFAFAAEDLLLFNEISRTFTDGEKCDLSYIELIKPFNLDAPIAKNSPFKEIITRGLIYMYENGLMDRENRYWRPEVPKCLGSISFFYVSLQAVGVPFVVLLVGLILSIAVYIAEYYVALKMEKKLGDRTKWIVDQ